MNANWPEITSNLLPGQTAYDRPELCCRVFNMKLEEIMAELKSCKVFGPYMAHLGVIEFQKRCYPHAHLVYTFTSQGPQHMNEMDKWVWARIPDESIANGLLRGKVLKYMIHKQFGPFNVTHTTTISPKCHHHTHIWANPISQLYRPSTDPRAYTSAGVSENVHQ